MNLDKFHCFGSRWFCLQMQEAFAVQRNVIGQLSQSTNPKLVKVMPLLLGMQSSSQAVSLLRRDGLLNESHVLMRLLIERAINACYLFVTADESDTAAEAEKHLPKERPRTVQTADEIIQTSLKIRFTESYDSNGLEHKIEEICKKTKIPLDFLRLCISTQYPMASMAMSGSREGAICHLLTLNPNADGFFDEQFTTILFLGTLLLNNVIKIIAQEKELSSLVSQSDLACNLATDLMDKCRHPTEDNVQSLQGYWQILADSEFYAEKKLEHGLMEFGRAFASCIEAGISVTTLGRKNQGTARLRMSALFLKRALNDLRSIWLMLCRGYTAQGASIAASLFENALAIQYICDNEQRALQLGRDKSGELPWSVSEMCQFVASGYEDKAKPDKNLWKSLYVQYVWLCQFKHPTLGQALHDAGATETANGQYAVVPLPDVRESDLDVKRLICIKALKSALNAIEAFASASGVKSESPQEQEFEQKVKEVSDTLMMRVKLSTRLNIPITVANSKWVQKQQGPSGKKRKH